MIKKQNLFLRTSDLIISYVLHNIINLNCPGKERKCKEKISIHTLLGMISEE